MSTLISQKVSKVLRIRKEIPRRCNSRSVGRQTTPSSIVATNDCIVISGAQKHGAGECRNRIYCDAPWLAERYRTLGFEIKIRDYRIVEAGVVESVCTAFDMAK